MLPAEVLIQFSLTALRAGVLVQFWLTSGLLVLYAVLQNTVWVHFPQILPALGKTTKWHHSLQVEFQLLIFLTFVSSPTYPLHSNLGPIRPPLCPYPPGTSCFTAVRKKTGKDFSFSMTGDSSTWLCLCSLGSLYCVHLEHTAEIPKKRFLFSLSSHLYSATTFLPKHQAPQQILQHNFPGYHEPLL